MPNMIYRGRQVALSSLICIVVSLTGPYGRGKTIKNGGFLLKQVRFISVTSHHNRSDSVPKRSTSLTGYILKPMSIMSSGGHGAGFEGIESHGASNYINYHFAD